MVQSETTEETAAFYSRVAPRYAEEGPPYFAHAGRRLVEVAQLRPGHVVLDLGTGRGAVLLPAARQVGPGGRAIGIDVATEMLAYTRRSLETEHLAQASVQFMDACVRETYLNFNTSIFSPSASMEDPCVEIAWPYR